MSELKSLTAQLCAEAERALEKRLDDAFRPVQELLNNGINHQLRLQNHDYCWYEVTGALRRLAFSVHRERECQTVINDFLANVKRLSEKRDPITARVVDGRIADPRGADYGYFQVKDFENCDAVKVTHSEDGYTLNFESRRHFDNWLETI